MAIVTVLVGSGSMILCVPKILELSVRSHPPVTHSCS